MSLDIVRTAKELKLAQLANKLADAVEEAAQPPYLNHDALAQLKAEHMERNAESEAEISAGKKEVASLTAQLQAVSEGAEAMAAAARAAAWARAWADSMLLRNCSVQARQEKRSA